MRKIAQIVVAFSEKLNFMKSQYISYAPFTSFCKPKYLSQNCVVVKVSFFQKVLCWSSDLQCLQRLYVLSLNIFQFIGTVKYLHMCQAIYLCNIFWKKLTFEKSSVIVWHHASRANKIKIKMEELMKKWPS